MVKKSPFRAGRSLDALYENVEILTGQRGSGQYKAVTEKEVARIKGTINKVIIGSGSEGGGNELVEVPHAPVNVQAFGGFSAILVQWDNPTFKGYAHAEVWRANDNNFSSAVQVATTPANVFSDVVNAGSTYFYWVRFVNKNNMAGPYQGVNGVSAETSSDVAVIIDDLAEQLKQSDVFQILQGDVTSAHDELDAARLEIAKAESMLNELGQSVANTAKMIAMQIQQLNVAYGSIGAAETAVTDAKITDVRQVIADTEHALALQLNQLDAAYKAADAQTNASLTALSKTLSDADKALAQQITGLDAAYKAADAQTNASLSSLQQTVANNNSSMSQRVDTIEAKANSANQIGSEAKAAAQTNSQAIASINQDGSNAFKALWATKLQAGEITAGIGLVAKSDGTSQAVVSASQFFVYDPNKPGTLVPTFAIDNGSVVIPKALIEKATIQVLTAQQITADFVRAGVKVVTPSIEGGDITGSVIRIGAGGPYAGYNFYVDAQGNASMRNAWIEGHVRATSGELNNVTINESCTIKGHLDGATGSFSGTVEADKIIGDLVAAKAVVLSKTKVRGSWKSIGSFSGINNTKHPASLFVGGGTVSLECSVNPRGSGSARGWVRVVVNGAVVSECSSTASARSTSDSSGATEVISFAGVSAVVPLGIDASFSVSIQVSTTEVNATANIWAVSDSVAQLFRNGSAFN